MNAARWEWNYTGIETWHASALGFELYAQRDGRSKRIRFLRLSNGWRYRRWIAPSFGLGLFLGHVNYGGVFGYGGFEGFARCGALNLGLGFVRKRSGGAFFAAKRSAARDCALLRAGGAFLVLRMPKALCAWLDRRDMERFEREYDAYIASLPEAERCYFEAQEAARAGIADRELR